jgi:hypothetical protein
LLESIKTVDFTKLSDYTITVHGIKGSCYDIYADNIGKAAAGLEAASKVGDIDYITEHNELFIKSALQLINDIDDMVLTIRKEYPKPIKDKLDVSLMENMIDACKSYIMDDVNDAMSEIDVYQYETDDDLVQWLHENVCLMNYAQIVQKLEDYMKE